MTDSSVYPANLPKLLLISEAPLNQNGTGIDRTLFNLLDDYPMDRFMLFTVSDKSGRSNTSPPFDGNVATFKDLYVPLVNNRLGRFFNPLLQIVNIQLLDRLPIPEAQKIKAFAPEIVLICPNGPSALVMGYKVTQQLNCPFLIYFMDDWIAINHSQWLSGGIQEYSQSLLCRANGWLMISNQLEKELTTRYRLSPNRSLVVHNPVDVALLPPPDFTPHEGTFKVVYAGAIWPMHYDAVAVIAEAIFELRQEGCDIELILHTPQMFWHNYQQSWESWQVTYGLMIPYNDLQAYLKRADLLLVASSFLPESANLIRSSVQTKLTDYMVSGRPILSCGPVYAACNDFIRQWSCGVVCDTQTIVNIKLMLKQAIDDRIANQTLAHKGFDVVSRVFDKHQVTSQFFRFICEGIPANYTIQPYS
jgi:glycosyltransferase involved in cell wall biosynthesis